MCLSTQYVLDFVGSRGSISDTCHSDRTIISNLPSLKEDKSHHSLTNLVLTLNPRLYQPPDPNCSAEEARAHIESMDSAIDLLKKLLAMDATKRYTAHEALMHPFLNNDLPDVEKETEEVIHPSGKGVCGQFHKIEEDGTRKCGRFRCR